MSGDTHAAVGAATALVSCVLHPVMMAGQPINVVVGTAAAIVGALFPDLDSGKSKGNKLMNKVLVYLVPATVLLLGADWLGLFSIRYFGFSLHGIGMLGLLILFGLFVRTRPHRELSHSLLSLVGTTVLVALGVGGQMWVWYGIGYLSHLLADLLNRKGESLLWPLPEKFHLNLCSSSGVVNQMMRYVAIVVAVLALACLKAGV